MYDICLITGNGNDSGNIQCFVVGCFAEEDAFPPLNVRVFTEGSDDEVAMYAKIVRMLSQRNGWVLHANSGIGKIFSPT